MLRVVEVSGFWNLLSSLQKLRRESRLRNWSGDSLQYRRAPNGGIALHDIIVEIATEDSFAVDQDGTSDLLGVLRNRLTVLFTSWGECWNHSARWVHRSMPVDLKFVLPSVCRIVTTKMASQNYDVLAGDYKTVGSSDYEHRLNLGRDLWFWILIENGCSWNGGISHSYGIMIVPSVWILCAIVAVNDVSSWKPSKEQTSYRIPSLKEVYYFAQMPNRRYKTSNIFPRRSFILERNLINEQFTCTSLREVRYFRRGYFVSC